jgi:O-methyltransferase involved in polyketide biosynthesis
MEKLLMKKLSGIPETMLLTLYQRALETKHPNPIIQDEFAVKIVDLIDHDFSKFDDWKIQWGIAVRTQLIDTAVQKFLHQHPDSLIVTLGAGLCTRALRLDNDRAQWISIDLEDIRPFWEKLIGESDRNHFITCSASDFIWIDRIDVIQQDRSILFIAEGLFQYLPESEVKQIVLTIQQHFPNSEIIMEVLGKFMVNNPKLTKTVARTGAVFQWGVNDCQELETWATGIKMLNQWYFLDYHYHRQGLMLLTRLLGGKSQFGKVAQFRFKAI